MTCCRTAIIGEAYHTAIETIAGMQLFHFVVETDEALLADLGHEGFREVARVPSAFALVTA